ncbi:uncharacterized protein PgNI_04356 [Pyricularia grisea]|uniref:MADS-box MEF2 type transcription factor MIG1 n=1 Tax=Pyricularia grisea TaxID=148305 RepID=A0A6P8B9I2_PYRGI|nr:uncharacterized protein PgNI_04356 [Pyricularia grisea]TLD12456.1 hypothetical protein PgNI_04356 [Pyricularia grisea]
MGRRKIEIKAIKDDRNRSVTFLKRKGGLFKKAHELSVLCSVDVAVFIFGTNKKLYEYSSGDMRELITRYTYHGGATEHKGPSDFNGGDDDDDEEGDGTPPIDQPMDAHMMPPHFQGQAPFPPHVMRHYTPSASPPIQNGVPFPQHGHAVPRGHTPQPQMLSRPGSRNDVRRMGQPMGPQGSPPVNGFGFGQQQSMYGPPNTTMPPHMPPQMAPGPPFPYPQHPQHPPHPQHPQQPHQPHQPQMQPQFIEDGRRATMPASFPPHPPPPHGPMGMHRHSVSPPQQHPHHVPQLPPQQPPPPQQHPHSSPPQPQHHQMQSPPEPMVKFESPQQIEPPQQQQSEPQEPRPEQQQPSQSQESQSEPARSLPPPPPPLEVKTELAPPAQPGRIPQPSLLDTAVKKLPRQKQHSIFTPIDENRSILSQHLAAFHAEPSKSKSSPPHRSSSVDESTSNSSEVSRGKDKDIASSPPLLKRADPRASISSASSNSESAPAPPSRSNSLRAGPPRPRLKVQIPDEQSEDGSGSATAESASSAQGGASTDATSQSTRQNDSHSSTNMVLPPPSPSATALLSAGATGPPNPFAPKRPPQHPAPGLHIDTPVSALPSRFLNNEFLPSPSSFYPDWNFRGGDNNTLPSPLNFATPVVGTGPSFLRDEGAGGGLKRKSPDNLSIHGPISDNPLEAGNEPKRVKVDS